MPIKRTTDAGTETFFEGKVVAIETTSEQRNMSDTLDYSDWRMVKCTYALTYVGRCCCGLKDDFRVHFTEAALTGDTCEHGERRQLKPIARFQRIDVSNHFMWRGLPVREAFVDPDWRLALDLELLEDLIEYRKAVDLEQLEAAQKRAVNELKRQAEIDRRERDRPVVGKAMKVVIGRKNLGYAGTVAYMSEDRVLLKPTDRWRDRKVDGVWVLAKHLQAT